MAAFPAFFYEELQFNLHGSGDFCLRLIDLHGVCLNFIDLALNVLISYLLFFIHQFITFALTTNAIIS